jgi:predicted ribosomally synthesized peptide with SipW-like signal peptide
MRNVFLSVVVICALAIAGVSGTVAGFSDTEFSEENYFEIGSLDLKVSKNSAGPYDDGWNPAVYDGIGPLITQAPIWSCQSSDWTFDVCNIGDPQGTPAYLYIHLKDFDCYEVMTDKVTDGRTEPEDVAEDGGWLANEEIDGIGELGAGCNLTDYVDIVIYFDRNRSGGPEEIYGDSTYVDPLYISDIECKWIYLDILDVCEGPVYGKISLHFSNIPEDEFGEDYFADDTPFDHWPTNALMNDGMEFIIEWALTEDPLPADMVYNPGG